MGYDRFFGFDLQQRKTLQKLLDSIAVGGLTPEQEELLDDLGDALEDILAAADLVANIPTADPEAAGQVWNDGGTLVVSAGA